MDKIPRTDSSLQKDALVQKSRALGSQVFDHWEYPWGRVHEHWTDSDRLNASSGSSLHAAQDAFVSQWGPAPPLARMLAK